MSQELTITKMSEPDPWQSKHGTMYQSNIELSDGTKGQVNMKDQNRWSVGDAVEVMEKKETNYGNKLKIQKAGFNTGASNGFSANPGRETRIDASWAVGQALNVVQEKYGIFEVEDSIWKNQVYTIANHLLEVRDSVISNRNDA